MFTLLHRIPHMRDVVHPTLNSIPIGGSLPNRNAFVLNSPDILLMACCLGEYTRSLMISTCLTAFCFRRIGYLLVFWALIFTSSVNAQLEPEPHPFDTFLTDVLKFQDPTGIRGTLRYIDSEEQTIWVNWEQRSDDRPLFNTGWKLIPGEATLALHPKDPAQFNELQQITNGTAIEMIIQLDQKGQRLILSYQDLSIPPKVPL